MQWGISAVAATGVVFIVSILLLSCCTYEKEPTEWKQFSGGVASETGSGVAYLRKYQLYRKPTGLTRFPDGGQPKYLKDELALYIYSGDEHRVRRVGPVERRAGNPPTLHASWKDRRLVYWLVSSYNKHMVPTVSWSENRGIFLVHTDTLQHYQLLDFGEMPVLSPDADRVALLKRKAEGFHDVWVVDLEPQSGAVADAGEDPDAGGAQTNGDTRSDAAATAGTPHRVRATDDFKINWIAWPEPNTLYLYTSVTHKQVYRLDMNSGELTVVDKEYVSFPPQLHRKKVRELAESGEGGRRRGTLNGDSTTP